MSYQDYVEQLTYLLFLKMADERARLTGRGAADPGGLPLGRPRLAADGRRRAVQHYRQTLRVLGKGGMLGLIFEKAQNKIQDPAKLRRLWST
jgi:type I restriction enzyme M protein